VVSERTRDYTSPTVPSVCFRTVKIDIKHQRKILTSFFGEGHGLFGLILAAPLVKPPLHANVAFNNGRELTEKEKYNEATKRNLNSLQMRLQ